jgi:hypothetical protein
MRCLVVADELLPLVPAGVLSVEQRRTARVQVARCRRLAKSTRFPLRRAIPSARA